MKCIALASIHQKTSALDTQLEPGQGEGGSVTKAPLNGPMFSESFTASMHCFILVALPQTENKANSIVKAVKAHVEYTNEVSVCSYVCHHSGSISYPFGYITLHCGQGKVGVVTCRVLCTWHGWHWVGQFSPYVAT